MIADDIIKYLKDGEHKTELKKHIPNSVFVKIQNVADYVYDTVDKGWNLETDLPCVTPPWEQFWMEFKVPVDRIEVKAPNGVATNQPLNVGVMCVAKPCVDSSVAKYNLNLTYFIHQYTWAIYVGADNFFIDDEGRIKVHRNEEGKIEHMQWSVTMDYASIIQSWTLAIPVLAALTFCNCKNVNPVQESIGHKVVKKRAEARKLPLYKFYTLNIMPMKKVMTHEAGEHTGIKQALHICRGHFKNYEPGHGLFGRFHGLYWWEMQARGNPDKGEIIKDYAIKLDVPTT